MSGTADISSSWSRLRVRKRIAYIFVIPLFFFFFFSSRRGRICRRRANAEQTSISQHRSGNINGDRRAIIAGDLSSFQVKSRWNSLDGKSKMFDVLFCRFRVSLTD